MSVNARKSACIRFGHNYSGVCDNMVVAGNVVNWVTSSRYLGVHLESSVVCKTSFASNKTAFYRAFNGIIGKIGRNTSEEVLFELIKTKCLSELYYGTEACPTNSSSKHSFQFTINGVLFKIFGVLIVLSKDSISDICYYNSNNNNKQICIAPYFGLLSTDEAICVRQDRFRNRYSASENGICCVLSKY